MGFSILTSKLQVDAVWIHRDTSENLEELSAIQIHNERSSCSGLVKTANAEENNQNVSTGRPAYENKYGGKKTVVSVALGELTKLEKLL